MEIVHTAASTCPAIRSSSAMLEQRVEAKRCLIVEHEQRTLTFSRQVNEIDENARFSLTNDAFNNCETVGMDIYLNINGHRT